MQRLSIALVCFAIVVALTSCAATQSANRTTTTPSPVYTSSSEPGFIPAGTTVEVRTDEAIQATSAAEGRTYSAQITREVVGGDGSVLVPRGAPAQLAVLAVDEGGRVTSGKLQLALRSITINGQNYLVQTDTSVSGEQGLGANRRTATMVGGGAALGTLVGAIAGGGTGAAIGAATGAAAGAAVQVLTKGDEVKVPAETVLTFRLDQPVRLQGYRR